ISRGAADPQVVEAVYCDELRGALDRLEAIGVPLRQRDGTYLRTRSFGQPGPYWINFNGKEMKPRLAAAVRAAGCTVLDRVVIGDLLVREGSVLGAVGFHLRSGEVYLIRAGAVILAAGGTNRIYLNPTGLSFNTWLCPVNTGDAAAMALRAGAALANMEYMRMTLVPKGLSAAGLNAFMGMGAKLVNAKGEAFMERYDPRGTAAPRYKLVDALR
ncbi:MAG: FAD-binding protein, partial [Clostridia bacterium]|nr:FAD-binding protein [Clostridia bacterium]